MFTAETLAAIETRVASGTHTLDDIKLLIDALKWFTRPTDVHDVQMNIP